VTLLDKLKEPGARNWYAAQSLKHGWSRNVLAMQIDTHAYSRAGAAVTNFDARLPPAQSDLAREALKHPYVFDFLGLTEDAQERHIALSLILDARPPSVLGASPRYMAMEGFEVNRDASIQARCRSRYEMNPSIREH